NGQLQCETEFALPLAVGQWFFTLQAVDTSGQRSVAAVNLAEILPGGEDLPPAAVDHDLDPAVFDDVINDPLAGLNGDIFLPLGEGLNVIDLMDWLANAEDEAPPEEECAQGDWVCEYGKGITVTVEPRVDGNFITLQVDQAFEAPEGKVLVPRIMKSFSNHNITSLNFPPEWVAGQGAIIQPGAVFTWLDSDIVCGEAYTYTIGINAFAPNEVENYLAGQGYPVGSTIAYEMHTATSQRCGEDAFGQPSLTADVTPEGVELNWSLPAGDDWPAEGAGVILIRWNQTQVNPNEQDSVNLFEQQISQADLRAGRQFQFVDPNLECGNQYVYLLGVYDVNQRPGFSPDGWLAHTSIPAPLHFCPEGELTNIFLHLTSTWDEWVNGDYQKVEIDFDIPAGFRWPNGNNVRLTLWQAYTNENGEYVTEDIGFFPYRAGQNNNFHRNFSQAVDCSRERYDFFLTLESDGTVLNESRSYHIELPSCPPKEPPDLTQLSATNECLGVEQCIVVTWAPFQPVDEPPYEPAIKLLVERKSVFAGEWISVEMPSMELTSYQDSDMACTGSYLYRIVAVDAHGFRSSSPALQINTPACDQPWSVVVFPESE
ncbi:MAG: hypothetical protein HYU84_18195, partial [Chloroflexi bacterium]|nr:hypothetical protein [Chloroflexota bacterium]